MSDVRRSWKDIRCQQVETACFSWFMTLWTNSFQAWTMGKLVRRLAQQRLRGSSMLPRPKRSWVVDLLKKVETKWSLALPRPTYQSVLHHVIPCSSIFKTPVLFQKGSVSRTNAYPCQTLIVHIWSNHRCAQNDRFCISIWGWQMCTL